MFPLWIKVHFHHNHSLSRADYFKFLAVSPDTRDMFTVMFKDGLTPSAAHAERRGMIKAEFPDTWQEVCADRSRLPSIFWVYDWQRQWLDRTVGSRDGIDAYNRAVEIVNNFDCSCKKDFPLPEGQYYAKIAQSDEGETVIAIVDPFMHRVHKTVPQCGELVFIDATSNLDRCDTKLFHLVCPSPIGGLPVAELVTTREDMNTITFGLELLKTILPAGAFYGRGSDIGPQLFMTDDCDAEKGALSGVWPHSVLLLCIFHVLQAMWSWIWDAKHGIKHEDKAHLLQLFRQVLYAETNVEVSDRLEEIYADKTVLKYPTYQKHLMKDTLPKLKTWSIARRITDKLPTSNQNTNNLVECSFRYTKDIQFNRMKAFNLPDMLSIVLDRSEFYTNKCVDAGNNVIKSWLRNCHSRYVMKHPNIDPAKIVVLGPHCYLVPSEHQDDVSYVVDMMTRSCSCPQGRLCGPCKHKLFVSEHRNEPSFDNIPTSSKMRQTFMYLGTGKEMSIDWFLPIQAEFSTQPADDSTMETYTREQNTIDQSADVIYVPVATVDPELVKQKLQKVLNKLSEKLMSRIDQDPAGYSKALDVPDKTVDRLPARVDTALQKALCAFGKSVTQV